MSNTVNALRRTIHPEAGSNPIKTGFYSIFIAFFELCVSELKSPTDSTKIMAALSNLQSRLSVAAGQIRTEPRRQNINMTKGLIQPFFEEREPAVAQIGLGLALRFENTLRRSRVETAAFECKQGLLNLSGTRDLNTNLADRIVETICGIANTGPDYSGALFIGVADKTTDKERIEALDHITSVDVGQRYVVGVDREATILGIDLETYKNRIVQKISYSRLTNPLKSEILSTIDCISYRGLSVVCIWIPKQAQLSLLNDEVFFREGSSTKKANGYTEMMTIRSRFE